MCYTSSLRKGGLPIIRNFLHSLQGISHALPAQVQQRNRIQFRLKKFQDGKIIYNELVDNDLIEAFEAKGDKR